MAVKAFFVTFKAKDLISPAFAKVGAAGEKLNDTFGRGRVGAAEFAASAKKLSLATQFYVATAITAATIMDSRLSAALRRMGPVTKEAENRFAALSREIARTTRLSREGAIDIFIALRRELGLTESQVRLLSPTVARMASVLGTDGTEAAKLMKTAFYALGITTKDVQERQAAMAHISDVLTAALNSENEETVILANELASGRVEGIRFAEVFARLESNLGDVSGTTEKLAKKDMDRLSGEMKKARTSVGDLALSIGKALLPVLVMFNKVIRPVINFLSDNAIGTVVALTVVFILLIPVVWALVSSVWALTVAMLANPVGLIVAGVMLLIFAIIALEAHFKAVSKFIEIFKEHWLSALFPVLGVIKLIVLSVKWLIDNVGNAVGGVGKFVGDVGSKIGKSVPKFESGGMVNETGLAIVHKGEYVVPARGGPGGQPAGARVTITMTGPFHIRGAGGVDAIGRRLARAVQNALGV